MTKDLLKQAFLEGYSEGRGVESLDNISEKTAKRRFERWKQINDIGEDDE